MPAGNNKKVIGCYRSLSCVSGLCLPKQALLIQCNDESTWALSDDPLLAFGLTGARNSAVVVPRPELNHRSRKSATSVNNDLKNTSKNNSDYARVRRVETKSGNNKFGESSVATNVNWTNTCEQQFASVSEYGIHVGLAGVVEQHCCCVYGCAHVIVWILAAYWFNLGWILAEYQ